MATYPLLFTFLDKVEGNDFLAEVAVHGRLLAVAEEDGTWWMYGVNPGGLAVSGKSLGDAFLEFRQTLMQVLFDLSAEAGDNFYAFRAGARKFFDEVSDSEEWEAAREQVRAGRATLEGMRRETSESPRRIEINLKQRFSAKDNVTDPKVAVAA